MMYLKYYSIESMNEETILCIKNNILFTVTIVDGTCA